MRSKRANSPLWPEPIVLTDRPDIRVQSYHQPEGEMLAKWEESIYGFADRQSTITCRDNGVNLDSFLDNPPTRKKSETSKKIIAVFWRQSLDNRVYGNYIGNLIFINGING